MMASSSSATDVEASCFYTARVGECDSSAMDGVAVEETKSVRAEAGSTAARSEYFSARYEAMMERRGKFPDDGVVWEIEFAKAHMSEVTRTEVAPLSAEEEALNRDNREILQELEREHGRGSIFYGEWIRHLHDMSSEKLGRQIAEGGQAKIYEVSGDSSFLWKVFESGTSLGEFHKLWPHPVVKGKVPHCIVGARILNDGRFAFLMIKHWGDLRKLIDQAMQERKAIDGIYGPPFPYRWNEFTIRSEDIMQMVAGRMMGLHEASVFHRDLKASNILLHLPSDFRSFPWGPLRKSLLTDTYFLNFENLLTIADFECSIGVKGTGYWRAPEVLSALETKEDIMHTQWEKADVYSFGMVYFEVVTGRIPFDGELKNTKNDRALVIKGKRPRLSSDLDDEVKNLISKCWDPNPNMRPTFLKIHELLKAITLKQCQFKLFGILDEIRLPYHLATIEEVFDYPMALDRSIFLDLPDTYRPRIRLHLADGSIDNLRLDRSRLTIFNIFNYKVARLCCVHCKHKDDNIF